jgi:hypothetical protein
VAEVGGQDSPLTVVHQMNPLFEPEIWMRIVKMRLYGFEQWVT